MSDPNSVCVIGSIVYDFVMNLPRFPSVGETVLGHKFSTFIGGKGLNQAVQIHRLGVPVSFWGRVGKDRLGAEAIEVLQAQDFDTSGIRVVDGDQTAVGMIYVVPGGVNMIGGVPTANMNFTVDEFDSGMEKAVKSASIVSFQLEIPDSINERALILAKDAGVPTLLNAAPYRDLPDFYNDLVDYWVVNEIEAGQFFNCTIARSSDCEPMCCHPEIKNGKQTWIVTLGDRGAAVVDSLGVRDIPGIPVDAVDSTGAGDSFTGGFAVGISEGLSSVNAACFANMVAALSVTKLGGMTGLPTRLDLIEKFGAPRLS
jgi:ribokinase